MAYNNNNRSLRIKHAVEITKMYYEQGRQDRCHQWVWRKYIYNQFHVGYITYMKWLRDDPEYSDYMKQLREARAVERQALAQERTKNVRRPGTRGKRKPGKSIA